MKDIRDLAFVLAVMFAVGSLVQAQAAPPCPDGKCPLVAVKVADGKGQAVQAQRLPVADGPTVVYVRERREPIRAIVHAMAHAVQRVGHRVRCR